MQRKLEQPLAPASPGRALGPETARPTEDEIAVLAYELWRARGCPEGSPEADWLRAETLLKQPGVDDEMMAA
jgi:hypothetical protein